MQSLENASQYNEEKDILQKMEDFRNRGLSLLRTRIPTATSVKGPDEKNFWDTI